MNNNYLIPANTKRGQLILGLFLPIDLIILAIGIVTSLILLAILPIDNALIAVIAVSPVLTAAFLVLPVAYYHNIRQLIAGMIRYLINRKKYTWKGWCFFDESQYSEFETKSNQSKQFK